MSRRHCVFFLAFCLFCAISEISLANVPPVSESYEWAEPGEPVSYKIQRNDEDLSYERLVALRAVMAGQVPPVTAYVIPTADAHNSQYIAPTDARREWISGLSGSSGTAVVTPTEALLWTDGRYFTQFEIQVNTEHWTLMRMGTDATIPTWLSTNLTSGSIIGIDPTTYTRSSWTALQNVLTPTGITLTAYNDNFVDIAREEMNDPPSPRPNNPLIPLTINFTGRRASEKISDLLQEMTTRDAAVLVLTALDDIAYTLNLRGNDIPYNPVFFSYLLISRNVEATQNNVLLFWGNGQLEENISAHLITEGVAIDVRPYQDIFTDLTGIANELPEDSTIWLSQDGSEAIHLAAAGDGGVRTLSTLSPVALMKCVKNEVELQGFRNSHIKDGIAVVRFLRWVHEEVDAGREVTEIQCSDKLEELRSEEEDFMGPSFATIAGTGANGAIIHYSPSRDGPQTVIRPEHVLLVDSGGQYRDGTTDITRTRHMSSNPTDRQRLAFTRVLQGQIMLGSAVFPKFTQGNVLDILARKALFDVGLNYAHGTGHGVGHFLNVHEGPSGIGSGSSTIDPGVQPAMIYSNEPGFYEVGEFGIRHEDLVEVIEMTRDSDHIYAQDMVGDFDGTGAVAFRTLTLVPHQTSFLNITLLSKREIDYINDYHDTVLKILGPILIERGLTDDYNFLTQECAPLPNSGYFLMATPLLTILSVYSLWFRL